MGTKLPPVVGIEVSAGGLDALTQFVKAIPEDSGAAFVVVRKPARNDPSSLRKHLGEHARIAVSNVTDGQEIAPNTLYIAPPDPLPIIENGHFRLADSAPEGGARSLIGRFFASLAEQAGPDAFAVVLSGSGSDGMPGIRAVRAAGGVTLVQDSAANAGEADLVLPVQDIPTRIVDIQNRRCCTRPERACDPSGGELPAKPVARSDTDQPEQTIARYEQVFLHEFAAPFCVVSAADEIVYSNRAMTGFRHPSEGAPSTALESGLACELHRPVRSVLARCRERAGPVVQRNVVADTGNGALRLFDIVARPLEGGETMLVFQDVRQSGEAEARMRRLFDQAPANIVIFEGPEHEIIYSNPANTAVVNQGEIVGRKLREVQPNLEEDGIIPLLDQAYETGEPLEFDTLAANLGPGASSRHHFRQTLQPWFDSDGNVGGVMAFNLDISTEIEAIKAAEAARARTETVLNSLGSFVGLLTPDGTVEIANQPALEAAGLLKEDVLGRKFWECYWWSYDPEVQDRLKKAIERAASGEIIRYDEWVRVGEEARICIDFRLVPSLDETDRVTELIPSGMDITERARAEERKDVVMAELQHRVKNVLATVQSIMRFTARNSANIEEMVETLQDRLAAIARTHDGLTRQDWKGCYLHDLVAEEFAPYCSPEDDRFTYDGPALFLAPAEAMSLGLALHELATNAAKYGALSTSGGHVTVTATQENGSIRSLDWRETGGPPVAQPAHSGFGSFLVQDVLSAELGAKVDIDFCTEGLHFRLEVVD